MLGVIFPHLEHLNPGWTLSLWSLRNTLFVLKNVHCPHLPSLSFIGPSSVKLRMRATEHSVILCTLTSSLFPPVKSHSLHLILILTGLFLSSSFTCCSLTTFSASARWDFNCFVSSLLVLAFCGILPAFCLASSAVPSVYWKWLNSLCSLHNL